MCILIHSALSAAFVVSIDKPTINVTKLPKTIPVFNGYPEELVCDADGNPPPHIVWLRNANEEPCGFGSTLTVSEKGFYRCNATNAVGSVTRDVQVILKGKGTCAFNNTVQCRSCCHLDPFLNKKKIWERELNVHSILQSIFFWSQTSSAAILNLLRGQASFFFKHQHIMLTNKRPSGAKLIGLREGIHRDLDVYITDAPCDLSEHCDATILERKKKSEGWWRFW